MGKTTSVNEELAPMAMYARKQHKIIIKVTEGQTGKQQRVAKPTMPILEGRSRYDTQRLENSLS